MREALGKDLALKSNFRRTTRRWTPTPVPAVAPNKPLSFLAASLLTQACQDGIVVTDLARPSAALTELLNRVYLVRGIGLSYVITRVGRLAGSGCDRPLT